MAGMIQKIEPPGTLYLEKLFEDACGMVSRAAEICDPKVSPTTMRKWLVEAGVIPAASQAKPVIKRSIPALEIGDTFHYRVHKGLNKYKDRQGVVVDQTDKLVIVNLGKYRDTVEKVDVITGTVEPLMVERNGQEIPLTEEKNPINTEGVETVNNRKKIECPTKEELNILFEKAGYVVSRTAQLCDPPVSIPTMTKWLRLAGIIPGNPGTDAPPAEELHQVWDKCNHQIQELAANYGVAVSTVKKWLRKAKIAKFSLNGEVIPMEGNPVNNGTEPGTTPSTGEGFSAEDDEPISFVPTDEADRMSMIEKMAEVLRHGLYSMGDDESGHELVKKLVDFSVAPLQGRMDKLEASVASLAGVILDMDKQPPSITSYHLDLLADLVIRIARRADACQAERQ